MSKTKCLAMILAGGQGSRLGALTKNIAKPAVPFGGKYRIIDFPLSNCANSGIDTVGVLTQYRPLELHTYLGTGNAWDLDKSTGGVFILPPYARDKGADWYKGTADAIYQNLNFIDMMDPDYVLILSGDHIYKMDYAAMLETHIEKGAAVTVAALKVPLSEASRFGVIIADEEGYITEFEEKPANPRSDLASMGIYIFSADKLSKYLTEDEAAEGAVGQVDEVALQDAFCAEPGCIDLIYLTALAGAFHNTLQRGIDNSGGAAAVGDQNINTHCDSP